MYYSMMNITLCFILMSLQMILLLYYIQHNVQDLQEEMENHKEMFLSLDKTGRQLVSGLTSQEDASLLHR